MNARLIDGATLPCNAPPEIVTKVTMSSAERVRRHRARKKLEHSCSWTS